MATLQGKAVKNTYRQVLQIGANNVGVSASLQPVQDGAGVNTALSLSTLAATVNGDLTITGDLIITGGGLQIKDLIDDTVAALIQNGTGITWTYNDGAATLTGNFTGTTSVVPEGSNLYYTQGRFDSAFAAKSTTNLAEGTNLYFTEARGNANFATNLAASDTNDLAEGSTNLYFTNARARTALSVTAGTGLSYNNTTGVFNLAAIPNASLTNSSITINGQAVSLGGSVTLTTTNIAEGTNLYWTEARGNSNFTTNLAASTTTNLAEGTNLYYTQARFDTAFGNKSTTNLAEGTNLYYTQARFNSALAAKTTTDLAEGTNLYYTDARARLALSSSATGLSYANNSGVFSLTAGYAIPTTVKLGQYDIAYNRSIVSAAVSGTSTKTLSLTQQDANVITATWTDQGITTINGTANQIAATTVGNTTTLAFTNDVTMPNNLVVSGNLTINGTATYVNTESISSKDPLFEVANTNNTTDAVDIGYYGRYYDAVQERVEFTGLFRDASDAGKFKIFTGLVDEPTNVVNTTGTGYTVASLVANVDGNLNGTANAANILSTARTIAASGDATWSVSFNGSANVSSALTLANTGVTATTYGTSTAVPTIAVDSKGRITSASNTNITFPVTTVNGFAGTVVLTTADVAEGGANQYFTTARAQAAITGTAPISVASGVVSITQSSAINNGFLSSTDWNTFNNKLSTATAATTYVPYTGATGNVNIGTYTLSAAQIRATSSAGLSINANGGTQIANLGAGGGANMTLYGGLTGTTGSFESSGSGGTFAINHTSGSGIALNITKNGNGEGLYINKASGSGNAITVIGTVQFGATAGFTTATQGQFFSKSSGSMFVGNILAAASTLKAYVIQRNDVEMFSIGLNASDSLAFINASGTAVANISSTGAATFSNSVNAQNYKAYLGGLSALKTYTKAPEVELVSYQSFVGYPFTKTTDLVANADTGAESQLRILTATVGGNPETRIIVSASGGVGIGNSVIPSELLDIRGENRDETSALYNQVIYSTTTQDLGRGGSIGFGGNTSGTSSSTIFGAIKGIKENGNGGNTAGALIFLTRANGSPILEKVRITSNGTLQIGATAGYTTIVQGQFFTKGGGSMFVSNALSGGQAKHYTLQRNDATIFHIGNDGSDNLAFINASDTYVGYINKTSGVYVPTSDFNKKKDFEAYTVGLSAILGLKPTLYRMKEDNDDSEKHLGFIAQEVKDFIPQAFVGNDDFIGLDYQPIVATLVKAVQELEARIKELEAK
jgi:hypothetical protein